MYKAQHWIPAQNKNVICQLCPHNCQIENGKKGDCKVRKNIDGFLYTESYGRLEAINIDPVEKKPLYHFYPTSKTLSIGTNGCNLHCSFCQNFELSQCSPKNTKFTRINEPEQIVDKALISKNVNSISYTYNEPTVFYEYMIDTALEARKNDLKNIVISNGFMNRDPLETLIHHTDAFNIDLKAYNNNFYKRYTKAFIKPVLQTLKAIAKSECHLEITNLLIPGHNDNIAEYENMCKWIGQELGKDIPLHISKYYPKYLLNEPPTPPELMFECYDIASKYLNFVFLGNMATEKHSNTYCPQCKSTAIERTYYAVTFKNINNDGFCTQCGHKIIEHFK